ncbi:PglZ domain-containing protein [Pirellulales bacterium]|nr:PglZ domain-containing protein [Pirellulales bacterium]
MNALHEHLAQTVSDRLNRRRVVTWYDPRREFTSFVAELVDGTVPSECRLDSVSVGNVKTELCVFHDSFFEVKFTVEEHAASDFPDPLLIYVPGKERHDETGVLMELEAGGDRWEPQLKREARRVLKKRYGDGQIDQMLESENVNYADVVGLLDTGGGGDIRTGSLLEVIYALKNNSEILAEWIADAGQDKTVVEKGADQELFQLLDSRLGLQLPDESSLDDARRKTTRYILLGEFRNDLLGEAPSTLDMVRQPSARPHLELVQQVAVTLRTKHAEKYVHLADSIEEELKLATQGISPDRLGRIDTFRFEERSLLDHVGNLIIEGKFNEAFQVISDRRHSFWALHQIQRQEQWQAYGLAAELGMAVQQVSKELPDSQKTAVHWVEGYTASDGWYRVDMLHRRMESTLAAMTDPIASEKVIHRARQEYESLTEKAAIGFVDAFAKSDWVIPGVPHQTQIYAREVKTNGETICYVLVDALRYEMGVELQGLLDGAQEINLQPAVAAIPTITPVGMSALMPGADQSYSVVQIGKDIGGKLEASECGDLKDRRKYWKGRVPDIVDLELEKVLSHKERDLVRKIADAPLLLVRSLEIDGLGENVSAALARQVMDTAINNVARAIKRLAALGVSKFVVVADHGHLFLQERDESQRIPKPGGDQVTLHRRCWAGRGGSNPPSTVRITGSELGYTSDLDFVFPTNTSVFKAGGDLAYYHGGLSLQELLVPVLTVRMPTAKEETTTDVVITLSKLPQKIATRIVSFRLSVDKTLFEEGELVVRPVLLHKGQHVGHAGMVLDAEHDPLTHTVRIKSDTSCTVGIQLLRDDVDSVQIVVLDPNTDRILAQSKEIPVKLGIQH